MERFYNKKIWLYLSALLYTFIFYKGYIDFLNVWFDYAGFNIIEGRLDNLFLLILSFSFCLIPLFFYNGFNRISAYFCVFIYYMLYIPIVMIFYFNLQGDNFYVIYLDMCFMLSMIMLFFADKFTIRKFFVFPMKFDIFKISLILCIVLSLYMLIVYRNNLRFVGIEEMYEHRLKNAEIGSDIFTSYLSVWLYNVFIPVCLAYSFFSKKKLYFIIATLSCIIVYMVSAAKSVILLPVLYVAIYYFLRKRSLKGSMLSIGIGLCVLMIVALLTGMTAFSSILWMRTIGNGGYLTKYYHDFFLENPITYYSHINIINAITGAYPYKKILGEVVGHHYWNDADTNANFWATDGFAALGDIGILVSGILLFGLFVVFNTVTKGYNKLFLILIFIPYVMGILNSSLFSSLLTGGGFFMFFFLNFSSSKKNKFINL